MQYCYAITESGRLALAEGSNRAKAQMAALQILVQAERELSAKEIEAGGVSAAVLRTLLQKSWCSRIEQRVLRNSYAGNNTLKQSFDLTEEQAQAVNAVSKAITENSRKLFIAGCNRQRQN